MDLFWTQLFNGRLGQEGVLTDFEDCGERGTIQSSEPDTSDYNDFYDYYDPWVYNETSDTPDVGTNCLWDCKWKFNPYFKSILSWEINITDKVDTVAVFMTSPRIPTDLTCLKDCFPNKENKYLKKCTDELSLSQNDDGRYDRYIRVLNCIVMKRKRERKEKSLDTVEQRNFLNIFPERRKGKVASNKCVRPDCGWYIRAANPSDLALEFCLLACKGLDFCDPNTQIFEDDCAFLAELIDDSKKNVNDVKTFGSSTTLSNTTYNPWLCSLKEKGFRGRHRCGVTMLSGPPHQTILASAAHCNYVCKEKGSDAILEICCCREDKNSDASCQEVCYQPYI